MHVEASDSIRKNAFNHTDGTDISKDLLYSRVDDPKHVLHRHCQKTSEAHSGKEQKHILLMPALSIGNVGQLAIDLVLEAFKKDSEHVAVLKHPSVLPCYGPNPYCDFHDTDRSPIELPAAHPLDLYQILPSNKDAMEDKIPCSTSHTMFVLQQRAPAAAGCQVSFGKDLMRWLSGVIDEVWIIGSLDASFRHDDDIARMEDSQVRCVPSDEGDESCNRMTQLCASHGIRPLYAGPSDTWYRKLAKESHVCMPWALLNAAREANVPAVGVLAFVVEGDNRRDGHGMADDILNLFHEYMKHPFEGNDLKEPPSWNVSL